MDRERALRKVRPTRNIRSPSLSVDPEKYPNLGINPALERALRIMRAEAQGKTHEEAVQVADQAMGARPKRNRGPSKAHKQASGHSTRAAGKAARPAKGSPAKAKRGR
ncbi:MAG: hypothetical protein WC876_06640 [Candidatus Thermoplasmatota archaeon]|jgi:hypothetical protein